MEGPPKLIDALRYCPLCGSAAFAQVDGVRRCQDCGHTNFNNPIASVAVWILDPERRALLIERANDPARGKLAPPGGFLDAGESLEAAAEREVQEEIGLAITALTYLGSHPNEYLYRGLTCTVCDTFFTARAATLTPALNRAEAACWVMRPVDAIDPAELAFDSMRAALRRIRQIA